MRPKARLSDFCTQLTGIKQSTVDAADDFETVLQEFLAHLARVTDGGTKKVTFLTCGDWDLKSMLPRQCTQLGLAIPRAMSAATGWINVKFAFKDCYKKRAHGMAEMLRLLNLPLVGRHHSGIGRCFLCLYVW